jgi:hypothetical protein
MLDHWGGVVQTRAYLSSQGAKSAFTIAENSGIKCRLYEETIDYENRIDLEG